MLFLGLHRNHFILSDDLLAEYRAVLLRPAVVARHGLPVAEVDTVLEGIVANAGWREAVAALRPAPTPAELAAQLSAEASGNAAGAALAPRLPQRG